MGWVDMGGWACVIDALEDASAEGEVFRAIRDTLGEVEIRHVINTHTHHDHVALNRAFKKRGATVLNRRTADIPDEGKWLEGDGREIQIYPVGGLHTADDCLIWLPQDRVLFVGDLFGWGLIPTGRLDDATAEQLVGTYRRMIDFGADVVVPGHGPLGDTDTLRRWVDYFGWLIRQCRRRLDEGQSPREASQNLPVPENMRDWWRLEQWKHENNLSKVLQAVRAGKLRRE
jgi:glyoxylase-like metal-dependent hydrolase (beta-lactamase superfamily II)